MSSMLYGCELRTGDIIEVQWHPNKDVITRIEPYDNHSDRYPAGARFAYFAVNSAGAIIDNGVTYALSTRAGE